MGKLSRVRRLERISYKEEDTITFYLIGRPDEMVEVTSNGIKEFITYEEYKEQTKGHKLITWC